MIMPYIWNKSRTKRFFRLIGFNESITYWSSKAYIFLVCHFVRKWICVYCKTGILYNDIKISNKFKGNMNSKNLFSLYHNFSQPSLSYYMCNKNVQRNPEFFMSGSAKTFLVFPFLRVLIILFPESSK